MNDVIEVSYESIKKNEADEPRQITDTHKFILNMTELLITGTLMLIIVGGLTLTFLKVVGVLK